MTPDLDRLTGSSGRQTGTGERLCTVGDEVLNTATQAGSDTSQPVAECIQLTSKSSALPRHQQLSSYLCTRADSSPFFLLVQVPSLPLLPRGGLA